MMIRHLAVFAAALLMPSIEDGSPGASAVADSKAEAEGMPLANVETGGHAADPLTLEQRVAALEALVQIEPGTVHQLEQRVGALETAAIAKPSVPPGAAAPTIGRVVVVREHGKKDAPGIVAEVFEDTITCNVFRGDHLPHVASQLRQIPPDCSSPGWFWPPRS